MALAPTMNQVAGPPELRSDEITIGNLLGQGSWGAVYVGECRNATVAVKILKNFSGRNKVSGQSVVEDFRQEVATLARVSHPNVCLFMGACFEPTQMMIVIEFCQGGSVEELIYRREVPGVAASPFVTFRMVERVRIAQEAARGIAWLHGSEPAVIHRDIKPENLLLNSHGVVKVADFGLSQLVARETVMRDVGTIRGSPRYMAPEVLSNQGFDERSDVYSFGITLFELFLRSVPYVDVHDARELYAKVVKRGERPAPTSPDALANVPLTVQRLFEQCWASRGFNRPTMSEVTTALDASFVEAAIPRCLSGQCFWVERYRYQRSVPSADLLNDLLAISIPDNSTSADNESSSLSAAATGNPSSGLVDIRYILLDAVLDDLSGVGSKLEAVQSRQLSDSEKHVSVQTFGALLDWFGPLDSHFLNRVCAAVREPWFHGTVTHNEIQARLCGSGNTPGTFLISFSQKEPGAFTLHYHKTVRSSDFTRSNPVKRQRVQVKFDIDGQTAPLYCVSNQTGAIRTYQSLQDVISAARTLYPPASGSKFQPLLTRSNDLGSGDSGYQFSSGDVFL